MKNFSLSDAERYIKRCMKNKLSINKALVIGYLITGVFSFDAYGAGKINIVVNAKEKGSFLKPEDISTIGKDGIEIGDKSVILSEGARDGIKGRMVDLNNNDPEKRFRELSYGYTGFLSITHANNKPENKFKTTIESVLIGHRSVAYGSPKNLVAIGHMAAATTNAVALGDNTAAVGDGTIAIGKDTYVGKGKSIAIGYKSYSYHTGTVGIGPFNYIAGDYGVAIGYNSVLESNNSVAIGLNARVHSSRTGSVAIGSDSLTTANLSKAGHLASTNTDSTWIPTHGEFAIGNDATVTRRITGVAAGEKDTDAVNVAQLKAALNSVGKNPTPAPGTSTTPVDVSVEKDTDQANNPISVKTVPDKSNHYKIGLNETQLIDNVSKDANIKTPKTDSKKLVTDKQVHDYVEGKELVFANDKGTEYKLKLDDKQNRFDFLGSNSIDVKTENGSGNVGNGFKFELKNGGVTKTHLANNAVTTDKIQDANVTESKLEGTLKDKINNTYNKVNNDGIIFAGNTGSVKKKLTETLNVKGYDNITTGVEGDELKIKLNKTVDLSDQGSLTVGSSKLTKDGLNITKGPSVTTSGIDAANKVISNVATPTENNHAANKEYVDSGRTTVKAADNSIIKVEKTTDKNEYVVSIDISTIQGSTEISYKANKGQAKSVSLKNGLDFTNGTSTVASVNDNGVVTFDLNQSTKDEIGKIKNKLDKSEFETEKQKLENSIATKVNNNDFNNYKTEVDNKLNDKADKRLSNLDLAGKTVINDIAKEAIEVKGTDKEIVVSTEDKEENGLKKKVHTVSLDKTVKDNIQAGVDAKNAILTMGITFEAESGQGQLKKLGESIKISGDSKNITTAVDTNGVKVNLKSDLTGIDSIESTGKKNKIELKDDEGIKLTSKDKTVTIKGDEISGVSKIGTDTSNISFDNIVGSDKVTKLTVDENTVDFKKSTTENEKDKVLISNVATPTDDYDAANKKYVDDTLTNSANTLKGLGMKFKGDDDQEIKRSLGETLNIKGKSDAQLKAPTKAEELSNGNISVLKNGSNDTLTIGLSKKLNDLSSAKFDGTSTLGDSQSEKVSTVIDGEGIKAKEEKGQDANPKKGHYLYNKALLSEGDNSTETTAKGTTVRDVQNKKITSVQADGTTIKELKDDGSAKDDGKSAEYKLDGIILENKDPKNKRKTEITDSSVTISGDTNKEKVTLDKDGITFTKEDNSEGIKINAKDSEISGTKSLGLDKDNNISFNNEDKYKNKTTKISVDGNSIELKKSKEKDETAKIVISNVATPQEDYDAVNKKYVDNEIKEKTDEISNNVPVVYTDKDGNKIIKKGDKFYKTDDKGQATKVEVPKDKVFVSLKEKTQLKNLKSGLGIDDIKTHSDSEKQGKSIEKVKDLTEGKLDTELNNAANIGDLKALALSGMDFVGNDNKTVHRNLGQTLSIKGKGTDSNNFLGADGNINVTKENDGLVVELSKKLQNLEEAVFTKINTDGSKVSSKVDGEGTEIKELDKDGNPKQDGKSAEYKLNGSKITDGNKFAETTAEGTKVVDGDKSTEVKADGITIKNGDNKVVEIKNKYGKGEIDFGKDKKGKSNGKISGLADIKESDIDGSVAANKNYVDSRVGAMETKFTDELGDASALNAALAGLKPLAYDPIRKSQFAAAMGYYKGKTAFALGLNHYTSENTLINGGVSFASGSNVNNRRGIMLNLGITHKFGSKKDIESLPTQYQEGPITALYVLQQELQKVIAENSKLKTTVQTQAKENAEVIQKLEKQEKENAELKTRMDKQEEQIQMLLERIK